MFHGDQTALMAMRMAQAAELERMKSVRQELEDLRHLLRWRREMKYSPEQPRDADGRWMPWEHGEGDGSVEATPSDTGEAFGAAPDGTAVEETGGIPEDKLNWTTQEFMSKFCRGEIRAEMPGQFLNMPIRDVIALAKQGDRAANTCWKLLRQDRFRK